MSYSPPQTGKLSDGSDILYVTPGRPDEMVSPETKKDPLWILAYFQYLYSRWNNQVKSGWWKGYYSRFELNDSFADGVPPTWKYEKMFDVIRREGMSGTPVNIDWTPRSYLNKLTKMAVQKVLEQQGQLRAKATDPFSSDERDLKESELEVEVKEGPELRGVLEQAGIQPPQPPPDSPQTIEELAIHKAMGGIKLNCEMAGDEAIEFLSSLNDYPEIQKECADYLVRHHIATTFQYVDNNHKVCIKSVHPKRAFLPDSNHEDYRDQMWGGYFESLTMAEFEDLVGDECPREKVKEIFEKYGGQNMYDSACGMNQKKDIDPYSNYYQYSSVVNESYRESVVVLNAWFYSPYYLSFKEEKVGYGKKRVSRTFFEDKDVKEGKKPKKVTRSPKMAVWRGLWVVGSDCIFKAGLDTAMKRERDSLSKTPKPQAVYRLKGKSPLELGIPIEEQVNLSHYKIQDLKAKTGPPLVAVGESATLTSSDGTSGALTVNEQVTANLVDGVMIVNDIDPVTQQRVPIDHAIKIVDRGMSIQIDQLYQSAERDVREMELIMGYNDVTAGGTPSDRTTKEMSQQMTANTSTVLRPLARALSHIGVKTFDVAVGKLQEVLRKNPNIKGYMRALGSGTYNVLARSTDFPMRDLGIFIEERWTDQEEADLNMAIQEAIAMGIFDPFDKLLIKKAPNESVRLGVMLAIRKQKEAAIAADREEGLRLQMEGQTKANQEASQAKIDQNNALVAAKTEGSLALEQAKAENDRLKTQLQEQQERQRLTIENNNEIRLKSMEGDMQKMLTLLQGNIDSKHIIEQKNADIEVEKERPKPEVRPN